MSAPPGTEEGAGSWVEVQVELPAALAEVLAATVAELAGGVELRDADTMFSTERDRTAVVALCRPDELADLLAAIEEVLDTARAAGEAVDPVVLRQRPAHEDEWRDVWKQFFRTTRIGRRFAVRPSWDPEGTVGVEQVIELDPGRAFGTGAHPSTRLVIAALEGLHDEGVAVGHFLDLGCGSGILTIAAHRLWPQARALAADIDPEAAECTRENLARNGIAAAAAAAPGPANGATGVDVRTATLAELSGEAPFDLVLANIQRDVLEGIAEQLREAVAHGGHLVLSGLLTGDADPVLACYQSAGFTFVARADEGEWASLLLR